MSDVVKDSMKGHAAIAQALASAGVDTLFGLIGDGNLFMVNSYVHDFEGTYVGAAHEAAAMHMALGYAQTSGKVGVATVTHGPALANTLTALIEGVKGNVCAVLLCGDTAVEHKEHLQNINQRELVMPTGAGFEQLRSSRTIAADVATALRRARVEHRPIVLNVPAEIQWDDVKPQPLRLKLADPRVKPAPGTDVDEAVGLIATAKRPLVLAGRGAASAQARQALLKLAQRIDAPVATTLKAKDLFRGEARNIGIFGTLSTPVAVEIIGASDCVISFGASLNEMTTSQGSFLRNKRVVQVHAEAGEVGTRVAPDACMVGDPVWVADLVLGLLDEAEIEPSGFFDAEMQATLEAYAPLDEWPDESGPQTLDLPRALARMNTLLPADRIYVTDGGRFSRFAWKLIDATDPQSFVQTTNFGAIGMGLPQAIGAAFSNRARPVVLVTGDGGFMLGGLAEFHTAIRERIDLVVVVCDDGSYGAEHIQFKDRGLPVGLSIFEWPDFAKIAVALGADAVTVRSNADFSEVAQALAQRDRPLLIDLKLDPDRVPSA